MRRASAGLFSALNYFTTLPGLGASGGGAPNAYALSYLPIAGILTGALAGLLALAASVLLPQYVVACVAFAAIVCVTGAIHVDGFLDSCDALFATASPQRRLEIMKDPRHGTFALVGMAVLLVFWIAALYAVEPRHEPLVLAFAAGASRVGALLNALRYPYARAAPVLHALAGKPSIAILILSAMAVSILGFVISPWAGLVFAGSCLLAQVLGSFCARRLGGGLTGDTYGFIIVVTEVFVLTALTAKVL